MGSIYLRKYGTATTLDFCLYKLDGTGLKTDAASASGDVTLYRDEANVETLDADAFVDEGAIYSLALSQAEMQAARIIICVVDQSGPQVWLDKTIIVETYGNASAQHEFDLDTATQSVSVTQIGGVAQSATDLKDFADTGYDPTSHKVQGVVLVDTTTTNTDVTALQADVGDASASALGSIYGILGNPAATPIKTTVEAVTPAVINTQCDTALSDIDLDHLAKVDYGATKPTDGSLLDQIMNKAVGQTFDSTTDSLEAIKDALPAAAPSAADCADAVWDEATSGHTAAGSFGQRLQLVRAGTAQAGSDATHLVLDAGASATSDLYNNETVFIVGGTGVSQTRRIIDYVGASKTAEVDTAWATTPDNTSVFMILPQYVIAGSGASAAECADAVWDEVITAAAHAVGDSAALYVRNLYQSVVTRIAQAQAGAAGTITLDLGASAVNDFYKGQTIAICGGAGAGQSRACYGYVGATQVASIRPVWATNPDATSWFAVLNVGSSVVAAIEDIDFGATMKASINTECDTAITDSTIHTDVGTAIADIATLQAMLTDIHNTDLPAVKVDTAAIKAITDLLTLAGIADAVMDEVCETNGATFTQRQATNIMLTALAGRTSGGGTNTITLKDPSNTKSRIVATVDADGNRTAIGTCDGS